RMIQFFHPVVKRFLCFEDDGFVFQIGLRKVEEFEEADITVEEVLCIGLSELVEGPFVVLFHVPVEPQGILQVPESPYCVIFYALGLLLHQVLRLPGLEFGMSDLSLIAVKEGDIQRGSYAKEV